MIRRLALISLLTLCGCTSVSTQHRPSDYFSAVDTDSGTVSLFSSDAGVLSDAEIQRILAYEYNPPTLSRVALLPAGWTRWGAWSEELTLVTREIDEATIRKLRGSSKVYDASFLPTILVPKDRTVPYLREAAARYQADLMLVFRTSCQSFQRYRVFKADTTRAFCSVESVLLDVRTGLVPFTASATRSFDSQRKDSDLNMREAILKAQLSAVSDAMEEISGLVIQFLERPRKPAP